MNTRAQQPNPDRLDHYLDQARLALYPELVKALEAASHALRSYQYGNSATDLAEGIADNIDALLSRLPAERDKEST